MTFWQFFQLTIIKVQLNLKSEAAKSYLSYTWWILEPALFVGVFFLVFGVLLGNRSEGFIIFLVCGKIPYLWFARTVNNSANAILAGGGLINQVAVPKVFFPAVVILQDAIKSVVVISLMVLLVALTDSPPSLSWLSLPVLFICQMLFIAPVAILVAGLIPFVPDLKFIVQTGTLLLMFASGIFYDYKEVVLVEHQELFLLNPLANFIRMYRDVLLEGLWPDWIDLAYIAGFSALSLLLVVGLLKKFDKLYPRLVLQ